MKKLLIFSLLCALYINTMAQGPGPGFRIGGGLSVVAPISNLEGYSVGVGVDLLGQYGVSDQFAITGDIGYTTIFAKDDNIKSLNIVPIRAGIRFYPASQFYLGGKAGVGIISGSGSSSSGFAYAFGGGFKMDDKLDIGLNYEGFSKKVSGISSSFGYLGLRLGYFFN